MIAAVGRAALPTPDPWSVRPPSVSAARSATVRAALMIDRVGHLRADIPVLRRHRLGQRRVGTPHRPPLPAPEARRPCAGAPASRAAGRRLDWSESRGSAAIPRARRTANLLRQRIPRLCDPDSAGRRQLAAHDRDQALHAFRGMVGDDLERREIAPSNTPSPASRQWSHARVGVEHVAMLDAQAGQHPRRLRDQVINLPARRANVGRILVVAHIGPCR